MKNREWWLYQNVMYAHTFILEATWWLKVLDKLGFTPGIKLDSCNAPTRRCAYYIFYSNTKGPL